MEKWLFATVRKEANESRNFFQNQGCHQTVHKKGLDRHLRRGRCRKAANCKNCGTEYLGCGISRPLWYDAVHASVHSSKKTFNRCPMNESLIFACPFASRLYDEKGHLIEESELAVHRFFRFNSSTVNPQRFLHYFQLSSYTYKWHVGESRCMFSGRRYFRFLVS